MTDVQFRIAKTATEVGNAVDLAIGGETVHLQWPKGKKQEIETQAKRHALMRGETVELQANEDACYFLLVFIPSE